jgi:hypothetical protein
MSISCDAPNFLEKLRTQKQVSKQTNMAAFRRVRLCPRKKDNRNGREIASHSHNLHYTMDTTEEKKKNDESATCHALPCSIEFTGKAPVYLYFQPHPVENDTSSSSGSSSASFQAAQFRGRGILATPVAVAVVVTLPLQHYKADCSQSTATRRASQSKLLLST